MKKFIYIFVIILSAANFSCESWFDIKPKTLTAQDDLFSNEEGFMEALTGAYIKAAKTDLWGGTLTYGFIDGLAQRYTSMNQAPESYVFTSQTAIPNAVWSGMYNLVANLNNLIEWSDRNRSVLTTPGYYEIIRGEALGLRAYCYFDLLRMFGPVYVLDPAGKSVPYRTELNRENKVLENADALLDHIIADLLEAEKLMSEADPLDFDHIKSSARPGEDAFLIYRFKRMNLMAVKGLLARAYLYRGDAQLASKYASEVVDSGKFKLIATMKVTDRFPVTELVFGLHFNNAAARENLMNVAANYVINRKDFLDALFNVPADGPNDIRYRDASGFYKDGDYYRSLKYDQTGVSESMKATIPLIRLPEMYYILAECAPTLREATAYINEVRDARAIDSIDELRTEEQRLEQLELEYRKEFYAEGQLWYFYKRHFYRTFLHCPVEGELTQANYRFGVPENEYLYGGAVKE